MTDQDLPDARPFLGRTPGVASPTVAIQEINTRMEAAGIWAQWDQTEMQEINLRFVAPNDLRAWVKEYGKNVFKKNKAHFTGQCNIIYVPGIVGAAGIKIAGTNLILVGVDDFVHTYNPQKPEDDAQGTSDLMKRTIAHEFGHFIGIDVKVKFDRFPNIPAFNAEGYHDGGKFPPLSPHIPEKSARALMQIGAAGLPMNSGHPGRWIRHEDWEEANASVKKTLNPSAP